MQFIRLQADNFDWNDLLQVPYGPTPPLLPPSPGGTQPPAPPRTTVNVIDKFHLVTLDETVAERNARVIAGNPALPIKTKALNTWLTYSVDTELQRYLAKHHKLIQNDGVIAWKLLTTKCCN